MRYNVGLWVSNQVSRIANLYGQQISMVCKFCGQQFYGQQILCSASSVAESNIKALPLPCIREMSVWESVLLGGRRKQVPKRHLRGRFDPIWIEQVPKRDLRDRFDPF